MKRILTSLIFVVLLFPSLALGETINELVKRDGFYYKKFSDVPFTGTVTGQWDDGFPLTKNDRGQYQGKMRNGKKDGPWIRCYENGQLREKGTYKDGKEEGPWVHYHNGTVWGKYTGTYKNGVKISD